VAKITYLQELVDEIENHILENVRFERVRLLTNYGMFKEGEEVYCVDVLYEHECLHPIILVLNHENEYKPEYNTYSRRVSIGCVEFI
jgi:hypothetical protein